MSEGTGKGRRRVAAVTGGARARIDVAQQRNKTTQWPKPGDAHRDIVPGAWKTEGFFDDTGELPEGCPIRPLGYEGENYYFVDTKGQVFNTGDKALGVERIQKLFSRYENFLVWGWPSFGKGGKTITGFKAEEVRRDIFAAADKRGPWSPTELVRGRGAWLSSDGKLVLHCGEYLWMDSRLEDTGEVGEHFYVRRPAGIVPYAGEVGSDDNPAPMLVEALRTWNFERGDTDVMLLLGWLGVAMMGAALDWRPSVFLVGESGTGKSELHKLLKQVAGRGMVSTTNATEAGLYQIVGHDSLPICIDELEGEDGIEQAQKIIKMARDAASGSVRIRGGADHKGVEFQARSAFLFSAINPPPIPPASLTRLAILQLNELKTVDGAVPQLEDADSIGPRLLRRVADNWHDFPRIYEDYRTVLREGGHNSRGQNTFGTLLASAHLLLGDEGMDAAGLPYETLEHWGTVLSADAVPELADKKPTWQECLDHILTTPIDNWTSGGKPTVARVLEEVTAGKMEYQFAQERINAADIGLLKPQQCGEGYGLAIPNQSKIIGRMLADTPFGHRGGSGSWSWALKRGPEGIIHKKISVAVGKDNVERFDNRISVAGVQRRCVFVSISDYQAWGKK